MNWNKVFPLQRNTNKKSIPNPNFAVKHSELPQQNISEIIFEVNETAYLIES